MVVGTHDEDAVSLLFHALADPTRRDIVRRTLETGASVSTLTLAYEMSFAGVQKHVAILESAGLVTKTRDGRERIVNGNIHALETARGLLDQFEIIWRSRMDRFGDVLAETAEH